MIELPTKVMELRRLYALLNCIVCEGAKNLLVIIAMLKKPISPRIS